MVRIINTKRKTSRSNAVKFIPILGDDLLLAAGILAERVNNLPILDPIDCGTRPESNEISGLQLDSIPRAQSCLRFQ